MARFILSAFADEIDPNPEKQVAVLKECGIRHIELRSILETNILDLSELQRRELKSLLDKEGIRLSALGSPIGKVPIDEPFGLHFARFKHAVELCKFFETDQMRIFSYYPARFGDWPNWRIEVMYRMRKKLDFAAKAGVRLVHENEHRIYGDSPERVCDLLKELDGYRQSGSFGLVYDPANYVFCGYDPWQAWQATRDATVHFHIKDWRDREEKGCLAGQGEGRIPDVVRDAVSRGYEGFATLEPHLLGGGPTGGTTGPELFPKAVEAFRNILEQCGAAYE